jgi:hypothetical protein
MTFQRAAVAALMAVVTLWSAVDIDAGQSRRAMRRARRCGYGYGCGYNYQCCGGGYSNQCCTPQCGAGAPQYAGCAPCTSGPCDAR